MYCSHCGLHCVGESIHRGESGFDLYFETCLVACFRCRVRTEAGSGKNEQEHGKDVEDIVWCTWERDHIELKMRTFESPGSSSLNPLANLTGSEMKTVELELARTTHRPKQ